MFTSLLYWRHISYVIRNSVGTTSIDAWSPTAEEMSALWTKHVLATTCCNATLEISRHVVLEIVVGQVIGALRLIAHSPHISRHDKVQCFNRVDQGETGMLP